METKGKVWKVQDKGRLLLAVMEALEGNAHVSFEGNLRSLTLSSYPGACPWRITDLGQNHDAEGYCTLAPRIGQPLMLSAWPDLSVRNW